MEGVKLLEGSGSDRFLIRVLASVLGVLFLVVGIFIVNCLFLLTFTGVKVS